MNFVLNMFYCTSSTTKKVMYKIYLIIKLRTVDNLKNFVQDINEKELSIIQQFVATSISGFSKFFTQPFLLSQL